MTSTVIVGAGRYRLRPDQRDHAISESARILNHGPTVDLATVAALLAEVTEPTSINTEPVTETLARLTPCGWRCAVLDLEYTALRSP